MKKLSALSPLLLTLLLGCGGSTDAESAFVDDDAATADGATDDSGSTSDGGSTDTGSTTTDGGGTDPFSVPAKCSSGSNWTQGDRGSTNMHPGKACITCHATNFKAPRFSIAGTVFPTAHEPDDCNSKVTGVTVVITGADGKVINLPVSSTSGNFSYTGTVAKPYKAKVVAGGKERAMTKAQTDGDCNKCHTQTRAGPHHRSLSVVAVVG